MTHQQNVIAPDSALYENCPVLSKVEAAVIQQGTSSSIQWEFRDRNGYPIDLSGCFRPAFQPEPPDHSKHQEGTSKHHHYNDDDILDALSDVGRKHQNNCGHHHNSDDALLAALSCIAKEHLQDKGGHCDKPDGKYRSDYYFEVRIQPADEPPNPLWVAPAEVVDAQKGQVRFKVPNPVSDAGGIFVLNIGLCAKSNKRPVYIHRGMLAVERSAWSNQVCKMPTLSDVRMRLMDTDVENLLQNYVEFTTADILDSIVSAVREWNGTTPYLSCYTFTCYTFPWIEPWLWKITASLYSKAALRYMRNKLSVNHGGLQGDDLARDKDYLQVAQLYDTKWTQWMSMKKRELNLGMFQGTVESPYWLMRNDSYGRNVRGGWNSW
jgi:hypothetical protein